MVPAPQATQAASFPAEAAAEKRPAEHAVGRDEPSGQIAPAGHWRHEAADADPDIAEYEPGAQGVQLIDPSVSAYPPAAQAEHVLGDDAPTPPE
jgi:hypothetical protein